ETFGRLVQCRTGHSFSGDQYKSFVRTEDTACPCGAQLQTRRHVLQECPRYNAERPILEEVGES
ncbi:hypothetical protein BKA93DRAFT_696838, partial [Sparassis latifolia]